MRNSFVVAITILSMLTTLFSVCTDLPALPGGGGEGIDDFFRISEPADSSEERERLPLRLIVFVDQTDTISDSASGKDYWKEALPELLSKKRRNFRVPGVEMCEFRSNEDYCRDIIEIRPIHANTRLASAWLSRGFRGAGISEASKGRNRSRTIAAWNTFRKAIRDSEWSVSGPDRQNTDIYSAFVRLAKSEIMDNRSGSQAEVRRVVIFYSDMIHDASPLDLQNNFPYPQLDPAKIQALAKDQAQRDMQWISSRERERLVGVEMLVFVPPGNKAYDNNSEYQQKMGSFWRSYSTALGVGEFHWE